MNDRRPDRASVAAPNVDPDFSVEPQSAARIRALCDATVGLTGLWIFGSRARGDHRPHSDIDFEADAPDWTSRDHLAFIDAMKHLPIVYPIDCFWRQGQLSDGLRERIDRDRQRFWAPCRQVSDPPGSRRDPAPLEVVTSSGRSATLPPPDPPSPPAA